MSNPWAVRHAEKLAIHAIRPTERNATCLAPLPCRLGSTSHASLLLHPATSQAGLRLEMVQLSKDSIAPVWAKISNLATTYHILPWTLCLSSF